MRIGKIVNVAFVALALSIAIFGQDRGIEFLSGPEFVLSEKARAAGIDGTLTVSFKVDRTGTVKGVSILAGPIWPCGSSPGSAIKEVREAVKQNILASKFSPATKAGKPVDGDATLDFEIGITYQQTIKGKPGGKSRWVVDVGTMGPKALRIPFPTSTGFADVASVRVLIGETGDVIAAGTIRGNPRHHAISRTAACDARFPPTIVDGKATKVTGLITYEFSRWYVRVK
jgi:hypothetical protein